MTKHIFFLAMTFGLLFLTGCEEETFDPVLSLGAPAAITAPTDGASFVITEDVATAEFATFEWSAADFGFAAGTSYTLQADLAGNGFADPVSLVPTANATAATVMNAAVNNFLINRGISGGTAQDIELRVRAAVGLAADNNVSFSDPIRLSVTPFEQEVTYPVLYVPGSYQGWNPEDPETVVYSVAENGIYDGYVYFEEPGAFKFTDGPGWDVNYGDTGADGVLDSGGDDIMAPETGFYRLNVNINDLTYTATPTSWGLIGSATPTGWDADTDLNYDASTGILSITVDLVEGEFKFRANDMWDIDFGDTGNDLKLEYGGDNIPVTEAGNYTIELLLNQAVYGYTITKN